MNYDFDKTIRRRHTGSVKWDEAQHDVIPLWVADMDFEAAAPIREALRRRVDHGVFGYALVGNEYYDALTNWFRRRHQWTIDPHCVIYTTGVVPAISAALQAVTMPGEKVLLQTPVYNCFFSSIRNCGCAVADSPLVYENETYHIDFDDFEAKAADEKVTAFLLCNPHNPAGRVWTREELQRLGEICLRHHVTVISDEVHCELIMPGHTFTPYATIGHEFEAQCIVCNSPTKNFNIAGLQIANVIVANSELRRRVDRAININEVCDVNPFGIDALIAAYNNCEDWLNQLNHYLWNNYQMVRQFFAEHMPHLPVTRLEGTYLVWVDVRSQQASSATISHDLKEHFGVWVNEGEMYGTEGFVRINIACPRATLTEGLERMARYPWK